MLTRRIYRCCDLRLPHWDLYSTRLSIRSRPIIGCPTRRFPGGRVIQINNTRALSSYLVTLSRSETEKFARRCHGRTRAFSCRSPPLRNLYESVCRGRQANCAGSRVPYFGHAYHQQPAGLVSYHNWRRYFR